MPFAGVRASSLLALAALALFAACQDPSGVGLGLIDEEGGDPNRAILLSDSLSITDGEDVTGGFAVEGDPFEQERVLVGAATDPDFGDVRAEAYFDIRQPVTPSGFADQPLTSATLRLARDYVYGDSAAALALALYEVAASWNPVGAEADTAFAVGDRIAAYDVTGSDTLFALALPDDWVSANGALLQSDSVQTAFDGFQLRLDDGALGGAVVGFATEESVLRLTTAEDTVEYALREVFTHIERSLAPFAPTDALVLRDGTGEGLSFTLPPDTLGDVAVARATFRLAADASLLDRGGLTRALPPALALRGITASGGRTVLATTELNEADATYTFSSRTLADVIQDAVLGVATFVRYEIAPFTSPATVGVLPVVTGPVPGQGEAERRPRFELTIVPASN